MAITHKNRRGQTYYLHVGTTRTGKPKYYASLSGEGTLAESLPVSFEMHEQASGIVSVRRVLPKLITDEEVQIVEHEMKRVANASRGYVDRNREILTIYVTQSERQMQALLQNMAPFASLLRIEETLTHILKYDPVFRFILVDAEARVFEAQRFCYLSTIEDWISLEYLGALDDVARHYLVHIGEDSYYELI